MKAVWEYIVGYAPVSKPETITFYDRHDAQLYRDVSLHTIGEHGWELVTVLRATGPESGEARYEYFFKRNHAEGYKDTKPRHPRN